MSPEDAFAAEVASIMERLRTIPLMPRRVRQRLAAVLVLRAAERLFLTSN